MKLGDWKYYRDWTKLITCDNGKRLMTCEVKGKKP